MVMTWWSAMKYGSEEHRQRIFRNETKIKEKEV